MKYISILYGVVFSLLSNLGMPAAVTSALSYISLAAIAFGVTVLVPEFAIFAGLILAIELLLHH